jgi:hypothetical protein
MTVIVAGGCRRSELALLLGSFGGKCDEHTESGKRSDLHVSPPRRVSDRRIALSHIRFDVALALFWELCWHATVYGSGFSVRTESATYIVAAVIPPIIAPSGSRGVSDYCPCHGANQAACNRSTRRTARQPANQRTGTATNQRTTRYPVLPSIRASSERQCHSDNNQRSTHDLTLEKRLTTTADLT